MGFPKELFLVQDGIDEFACAICLEIIRVPSKIPECGHHFCLTCITRWFSTQVNNVSPNSPDPNPTCPTCRKQINTRVEIKDGMRVKDLSLTIPNREFADKLLNLQMKCEFAPCNVISRYADYDKHKKQIHQKELARKRLEDKKNSGPSVPRPRITCQLMDAGGHTYELNE